MRVLVKEFKDHCQNKITGKQNFGPEDFECSKPILSIEVQAVRVY